jgi:hypothetical protein
VTAKRGAGKYSLAVVMCFEFGFLAPQSKWSGKHLRIKRIHTKPCPLLAMEEGEKNQTEPPPL